MPDGQVLEFTHVTKRFNDVTAVSDFSARVEPGVVTAFLGPNGAGKTTTLRILLGQVRATSGTATIGGVAHPELRHPLRTIGSVLEETAYRPRRSAARQLTIAAKANGIPLSRVDEVLSLVGLEHEAEGRIGSFSLGMRQRLSVAHALLGDPGALVFDEPANGLDPEGIRWIRLLLRRLADEGRTVLVSSHVLSEIEQVADHVLVLSKGQLVLSSGIEKLADPSAGSVVVDAEDRAALKAALSAAGLEVEVLRSGLTVRGSNAGAVGAIAASAGIALATLVQRGPTLEDVFIELVRGGRLAPHAITAAPVIESETPVADAPTPLAAVPATPDAQDVSGPSAPDSAASDAVASDADASEADSSEADSSGSDAERAEADAADVEADAAADAADAARDIEYAAAELGYAADASDANDAEDAADVASDAAHAGGDEVSGDDDSTGESTQHETPAEERPQPSFDDILFGTTPVDAPTDPDVPSAAESGAEEHSGVEFFGDAHDSEDASESSDDVAAPSDDDPRSAAVTSMLAAAARAYYEDEPKDYPLGDADASADAQATTDAEGEHHEGEHHDGDHHEHHEGQHHEGEHHEGEHHEHHEGEHDRS
ncbi:ATP-binding cassette domain-containing protein [Microbacterium sp. CFBP9023]|uniref:ATP-binding cassette domain-containing protein n=1 Tax=Microbacterium sp. CFBP9023 TaxID=3096535 RepID=UPI002A6A0489|nr:ATP-binding cassette domain-containing protein [Microbacterium sp. CFBP9023]MDY0983454.1 ATP-binding cassette domain-containing protein [Microbacterium sp. CFBP9023]